MSLLRAGVPAEMIALWLGQGDCFQSRLQSQYQDLASPRALQTLVTASLYRMQNGLWIRPGSPRFHSPGNELHRTCHRKIRAAEMSEGVRQSCPRTVSADIRRPGLDLAFVVRTMV